MAVADAARKPSPPLARIVAALLALVPFVLAPMLALVRVVCLAAGALPYLGYAVLWVLAAASAAQIVAARAWGERSAPSVFLQALSYVALKVFLCSVFPLLALAAVLLCGTCLAYVIAVISGSGSEFKKDALEAFKKDSTRELFPRAAVLGWVASVPFILLFITGSLMEITMSSPVERSISKGQMIGSLIMDVGLFDISALSLNPKPNNPTSTARLVPSLALGTWRGDQSDTKPGLTV